MKNTLLLVLGFMWICGCKCGSSEPNPYDPVMLDSLRARSDTTRVKKHKRKTQVTSNTIQSEMVMHYASRDGVNFYPKEVGISLIQDTIFEIKSRYSTLYYAIVARADREFTIRPCSDLWFEGPFIEKTLKLSFPTDESFVLQGITFTAKTPQQ